MKSSNLIENEIFKNEHKLEINYLKTSELYKQYSKYLNINDRNIFNIYYYNFNDKFKSCRGPALIYIGNKDNKFYYLTIKNINDKCYESILILDSVSNNNFVSKGHFITSQKDKNYSLKYINNLKNSLIYQKYISNL